MDFNLSREHQLIRKMMADFTENVVREFLRTHRDELNRMLNALPRIDL